MYSESDIENAVAAGVLAPAAAAAFRDHVSARRLTPAVDEEHFRLLTGFNDVFVSIALVLLLVAVGQIGASIQPGLGGALVAGAAWLLATYFTARRRMALPSILLLLAFVGGVAAAPAAALIDANPDWTDQTKAVVGAGIALLATGAAWLHWRRFMVPITVAAGAVTATGIAVGLLIAAVPAVRDAVYPLLLAAGMAVFALAMRWDISDLDRTTRRSDVAFWLHLAAAPLIAHPLFKLLGILDGEIGPATAIGVLLLYLAFAAVALAVDRRALLVSSLAYVLYALCALIRSAGAVELGWAITAFVIGSALLSLSAFWQPMRHAVVGRLGELSRRLPPVQGAVAAA